VAKEVDLRGGTDYAKIAEKLRGYTEDSTSGETTDSYATILDWDTRIWSSKTLILTNTGTESLDYECYVRSKLDGKDYLETSGSLASGDIAKIGLNMFYSRVQVKVKSSTAGSPTTYRLDYNARILM